MYYQCLSHVLGLVVVDSEVWGVTLFNIVA